MAQLCSCAVTLCIRLAATAGTAGPASLEHDEEEAFAHCRLFEGLEGCSHGSGAGVRLVCSRRAQDSRFRDTCGHGDAVRFSGDRRAVQMRDLFFFCARRVEVWSLLAERGDDDDADRELDI